jgi:hypothetical protein
MSNQYERQRDRAFWVAAVLVALYLAGVITALQIPPKIKEHKHEYYFTLPKPSAKQSSTLLPFDVDPNGNFAQRWDAMKPKCREFPPLHVYCI